MRPNLYHLLTSEPLANVADPLTVATLNWDDLAARLPLPWYDGSVRQGPPPWPFLPDVAALGQARRYILLWLHGSVQWRQDEDELWYWDPWTLTMALSHILQQDIYWPVEQWADGLRFDWQNPALPRFPVVISPHKDQQIQQGPFRFYWRALDKALQAAQTLIVVGYSGHDAHLNAALRKAVTHSPTLRQLIWIDKQTQVTELCETVAGVWGEPWRDVELRRCDTAEGFSRLVPRADGNSLTGWVYSLGIENLSRPGGLRTLKQILHHLTA